VTKSHDSADATPRRHSPQTSESGWRRPRSVEDADESDEADEPDEEGEVEVEDAPDEDERVDDGGVGDDRSTRVGVGVASMPARAAAGSKPERAGDCIASTCSRNQGGRSLRARSNRSSRLESAR
jgi:hypothetical protein